MKKLILLLFSIIFSMHLSAQGGGMRDYPSLADRTGPHGNQSNTEKKDNSQNESNGNTSRSDGMNRGMDLAEKNCVKNEKADKTDGFVAQNDCKTEKEIAQMEGKECGYIDKYFSKDVNVPKCEGSGSFSRPTGAGSNKNSVDKTKSGKSSNCSLDYNSNLKYSIIPNFDD